MSQKDIDDALSIYKAVYGECDEKKFMIKHTRNPYEIKRTLLIRYEENIPVGVNAFMGMVLIESGREHLIAQSNDTAVLHSQRGKGLFTSIIIEFESDDNETEYCIGLPNEQSYPGFMKMGWEKVSDLVHYVRICKPGRLALGNSGVSKVIDVPFRMIDKARKRITLYRVKQKVNNRSTEKEYRVERNDSVVFTQQEYDLINADIDVGTKREEKIYNWKLSDKECIQYKLYDKQNLAGFFIIKKEKRMRGISAVVYDWMIIGRAQRFQKMKTLIDNIEKEYDLIEFRTVNRSNRDDTGLLKLVGGIDICKKPFTYRGSPLIVSGRYKGDYICRFAFRYIDADTVMN